MEQRDQSEYRKVTLEHLCISNNWTESVRYLRFLESLSQKGDCNQAYEILKND